MSANYSKTITSTNMLKVDDGIENLSRINLFSCPIYSVKVDPNSYDKEEILKDIFYNKNLKNFRNDSQHFDGCDIHHSIEDFDNESFRRINYNKLLNVYAKIFKRWAQQQYTNKKFGMSFEIVNYTAVTEGQWLPSHAHLGTDLSGYRSAHFACCHYIKFKPGHVPTRFKNPAKFSPYLHHIQPECQNIFDWQVAHNSWLWEDWMLPVEEDNIVIFPSAIDHEIIKQGPTEEPRVTISTNIKLYED